MGRGSGNIGRTNKFEAPIPATVTGARSGTSLSGTNVELGGLLSPLLHPTVIEMGLFDLTIRDPLFEFLVFNQGASTARLGAQNSMLQADMVSGVTAIGDVIGVNFNTELRINDTVQTAVISSAGNPLLNINGAALSFEMGDTGAAGNNTYMQMTDSNQRVRIRTAGVGDMLYLDGSAASFQIGDTSNSQGGTMIEIDGSANQAILFKIGGSAGVNILNFDGNSGVYDYGDLSSAFNNTTAQLDANAQSFTVGEPAGVTNYLSININTDIYQMGDITSAGVNNCFFSVNGPARTFNFIRGGNTFGIIEGTGLTLLNSAGVLLKTTNALGNGAGAGAGTLLNAPAAGNPTKWIPINDGGTTRHIPAW